MDIEKVRMQTDTENKEQQVPYLRKQIKKANYKITVHFNHNSQTTIADKIKHLIYVEINK